MRLTTEYQGNLRRGISNLKWNWNVKSPANYLSGSMAEFCEIEVELGWFTPCKQNIIFNKLETLKKMSQGYDHC